MEAVRRGCLRLGAIAIASMFLSLFIMMFLVEAPQVSKWFIASASVAGVAYATALLASYFEP